MDDVIDIPNFGAQLDAAPNEDKLCMLLHGIEEVLSHKDPDLLCSPEHMAEVAGKLQAAALALVIFLRVSGESRDSDEAGDHDEVQPAPPGVTLN